MSYDTAILAISIAALVVTSAHLYATLWLVYRALGVQRAFAAASRGAAGAAAIHTLAGAGRPDGGASFSPSRIVPSWRDGRQGAGGGGAQPPDGSGGGSEERRGGEE